MQAPNCCIAESAHIQVWTKLCFQELMLARGRLKHALELQGAGVSAWLCKHVSSYRYVRN